MTNDNNSNTDPIDHENIVPSDSETSSEMETSGMDELLSELDAELIAWGKKAAEEQAPTTLHQGVMSAIAETGEPDWTTKASAKAIRKAAESESSRWWMAAAAALVIIMAVVLASGDYWRPADKSSRQLAIATPTATPSESSARVVDMASLEKIALSGIALKSAFPVSGDQIERAGNEIANTANAFLSPFSNAFLSPFSNAFIIIATPNPQNG